MSNEAKKICPFCGAEINERARKCPNCKKWIEKKFNLDNKLIGIILLGSIIVSSTISIIGTSSFKARKADSCFSDKAMEDVISIFKDKAEWKATKEEHLYYSGKRITKMSEPEVSFVEPLSYDKGINKYTCMARIEVSSEESTKYSGSPESIERTTTAYNFTYSSYRQPDGKNIIIGSIERQWIK